MAFFWGGVRLIKKKKHNNLNLRAFFSELDLGRTEKEAVCLFLFFSICPKSVTTSTTWKPVLSFGGSWSLASRCLSRTDIAKDFSLPLTASSYSFSYDSVPKLFLASYDTKTIISITSGKNDCQKYHTCKILGNPTWVRYSPCFQVAPQCFRQYRQIMIYGQVSALRNTKRSIVKTPKRRAASSPSWRI